MHYYGENPSKYSVTDAPTSVRKRWARQGAKTRLRNLLATCREHMSEAYMIAFGEVGRSAPPPGLREYGLRFGDFSGKGNYRPIPRQKSKREALVKTRSRSPSKRHPKSRTEYADVSVGYMDDIRSPELYTPITEPVGVQLPPGGKQWLGSRHKASNPELLIVSNPRGRSKMRRRARRKNSPLTVSVRGRRHGWKGLVRRYGVRKAAKLWRKSKRKRHGYSVGGATCRTRRRRRRAANRGGVTRRRKATTRRTSARKAIKYRGRRTTWKGLVRKLGVSGASKIWRKSKKTGGKTRRKARKRVRRSNGRRKFRRTRRR